MEMKWKDGIYNGEVANNLPHGRGVLTLPNGVIKGEWQNGVLVAGCEYIGNTAYVGGYDAEGNGNGIGFVYKDHGRMWKGMYHHGEKIEHKFSDNLPNLLKIESYYGNTELLRVDEKTFFKGSKIRTYYGYYDDTVKFEMPVLSEAYGTHIVGVVEKRNNRWDYSKHLNEHALMLTDKDSNPGGMYIDCLLCQQKENGSYGVLDYKTVESLSDVLNDLYIETFAKYAEEHGKKKNWKIGVVEEGIFKGEWVDGAPTGKGVLIYNHDDPQGRVLYLGYLENGKPNGSFGKLYYRADADNIYYDGAMKNGVFHQGTYCTLDAHSGRWQGVWNNGVFEGDKNTYRDYRNEHVKEYSGKFVGGQIVEGYLEQDLGEDKGHYKYEGGFCNWLPHGKGVEIIKNGDKTVSWRGYFYHGKRLVSADEGGIKNALELRDPCIITPLCFESFQEESFQMQMSTSQVNFVQNDAITNLSNKVGEKLVVAVSHDSNNTPSKIAQDLFGVEATGSCILCGEGCAGLSEKTLEKLTNCLTQQMANSKKAEVYEATLLEEKHSSEWDVLRETHDDYPLEAEELYHKHEYYLVTVDDERYYAHYYRYYSQSWEAPDNYTGDDEAFATLRLHKIPNDLLDNEQIKTYVDTHNKWTKTAKTQRFTYGTMSDYLERKQEWFELLLSEIFGVKLYPKED